MMITNNSTSSTVGGYQPTPGLQNLGNASGSSSGNAPVADTVQLSTTAQVTAMYTDGMSVQEIASSMGLTTPQVNSYLGISTSGTAAGGGVAPAGGGQSRAASASHASGTSQPASETGSSTAKPDKKAVTA